MGIRGIVLPPLKGSERNIAPMTASSPDVIEIKLDRLIDDIDMHLKRIEAYLKTSEPSGFPTLRFVRYAVQVLD